MILGTNPLVLRKYHEKDLQNLHTYVYTRLNPYMGGA